MYCKRWIALAFLILAMLHVTAQQASPQERPWESMLMELMTADDIDADDWEDQYEALCDMEQEPLNINTATRELNNKVQTFPSNILAGMFGFQKEPMFEVPKEERASMEKAPEISF